MISKSAAKVQQIFDIRKDLHKKTHPKVHFLGFQHSAVSIQRERKLPFFAPLSGCHPCRTGEDLREQTAGREAAMFGYFFQGHLRMFGY